MADGGEAHENQLSPVRKALLSFFESLFLPCEVSQRHASNILSTTDQAVRDAAKSFNVVAEQHWHTCRTRPDEIYARFVLALNHISVSQLRKVCEGFRVIQLNDAYYHFNAVQVEPGAGPRALHYGCKRGIIPVALSYRHAPHQFTLKSNSEASETAKSSTILATVNMPSAERFVYLQNEGPARAEASHKDAQVNGASVVWIDRAVKGLSVDGDWFVRGLFPYCVVPVVTGYQSKRDMERPWIWLEFRLSSRAISPEQPILGIQPEELTLIALQALYLPSHIIDTYEYRDEMEAVILDMFAFSVSILGSTETQVAGSRQDVVAKWNDFKVGLALALAFKSSVGSNNMSMRAGILRLDGRNSYNCDIFRDGVLHMLRSAAIEVYGESGFKAYVLVNGDMTITRQIEDTTVVMTVVPRAAMQSLKRTSAGYTVRRHLYKEVKNLGHRYDLWGLGGNQMYDIADELAVLASCCVELPREKEDARKRASDDADVTVGDEMAIKLGFEERRELHVQFDAEKGKLNAERKQMYSLRRWIDRVHKREASITQNIHDVSSMIFSDNQLDNMVGIEESVAMWFDYNCGTLRWTMSAVGNGDIIFRRMKFKPDLHRVCIAVKCRRRDVSRMTKAWISLCRQEKFGWTIAEVTDKLRLAFQDSEQR